MAMKVARLTPGWGAEITGIDVSAPLDDAAFGGIKPPGIRHLHRATVSGDVPV